MSFEIRRLRDDRRQRTFPWKSILRGFGRAGRGIARIGAPAGLLLMRLKRAKQEEEAEKRHDRDILRKIALGAVTVLCLLLLFGGVARALVALNVLNIGTVARVTGAELPKDSYGHTNLLLLGQGDENHDGVDLTDTLMIASLDPQTKSAVLLSLPRDLYMLQTENMGVGRINALYRDYKYALVRRRGMEETAASQLAMRELASEIGDALDVDLHHVIKVDFIGFVEAVDAIGGVEVDVPRDIVDPEYPGPNYSYQTFSIRAGRQTLDGETALKYARSRHTTSDFDRSARQQQILAALAKKVKEGGMLRSSSRIVNLVQILENHVETTMTLREMVSLADLGKSLDTGNILAMQLNSENGLYGALIEPGGFLYNPPRDQFEGASVLLPVSIPEFPVTWRQLQSLTRLLLHTRTPYLSRPVIRILNAGAPSGSSRRLGGELLRYGFQVDAMENAEGDDVETSVVEANDGMKETAAFLSGLLGMELALLPPLPDEASSGGAAPSPVITITLGTDYTYEPLQELILPMP